MKLTKLQKETALNILEKVYNNLDAKIDYSTNLSFTTVKNNFVFELSETELSALFNVINKFKNDDL